MDTKPFWNDFFFTISKSHQHLFYRPRNAIQLKWWKIKLEKYLFFRLAGQYGIAFRVALHSLFSHTSINFHVGCQFGVHLPFGIIIDKQTIKRKREKDIESMQIKSIRLKCERIDWIDFVFFFVRKQKQNNHTENWIVLLEMMSVR